MVPVHVAGEGVLGGEALCAAWAGVDDVPHHVAVHEVALDVAAVRDHLAAHAAEESGGATDDLGVAVQRVVGQRHQGVVGAVADLAVDAV